MQVAQLFVETLIDIDKNLYDNNRLSLCRIGPGEVRPGKIGSTSTDRTGHAGPSSAHVTRYDSAVLTHRVAQQPGTRGVVETRQSLRKNALSGLTPLSGRLTQRRSGVSTIRGSNSPQHFVTCTNDCLQKTRTAVLTTCQF
jgi:hypothetical protein